jgi:Carboxypeptidase regulatory-like domain
MTRLLVIAAFAPALWAQNFGVVEGTVSDSVSHAGIAGVTVQLKAVDGRAAGYVGRTDATGRFRIENVLPGDYSATYEARNYAAPSLSQGAYKPFHVSAGADPFRLQVELEPFGRLSARVLDEDGHPAARVQVMMMRLHGIGGSAGLTDAQGRIAMDGIAPGVYALLARPILAGTVGGEKAERRSLLPPYPREGESYEWAATYFPNALQRSQAEPIRIWGGSDLSGYEVRLRATPVHRVTGVVLDEQGARAPNALLSLLPSEPFPGGAEIQIAAGDDGRFEFPKVAAGNWRLSAETKRRDVALKAATFFTVEGRDVDDLTIRLSPPFVVSGFVDGDEQGDSRGKRKGWAVTLEDANHALAAHAFHEQDGSFQIKDVYPGRYRITPMGFVPGYYLDSVWLGESNVMGQEVELSPSSPPIRVVYKPKAARVRGTVEDGAGSAVYLLPQDESLLDNQFIRSAACDGFGRFEVGSLRPGDYYAFAFDRVEFDVLTDPAFVRALAPRAVQIHVSEGEIGSVNLKVTAWPE